jgi:hypothetical protein
MIRIIKKTYDSAVVGIVTAMLIIGLIVSVIAIVQLVYVPIIMEQRESDHMDRVAEQFGFLTSVIDDQAADERKGIPIATFVTLGSKELPFLVSSKAYGTLEILENSSSINIENNSIDYTFPIGIINYSSSNAYFLDQIFTYEAGSMIVSQPQHNGGNLMMIHSGFNIDFNYTYLRLNISFDIVNISNVGQKTIATGSGICAIQTEFHEKSVNKIFKDVDNINISVTSPNSNAWYVFINSSFYQADLVEKAGLNLDYDDSKQTVSITYIEPSIPDFEEVNVFFRIIDIKAQIGPGWIEQSG